MPVTNYFFRKSHSASVEVTGIDFGHLARCRADDNRRNFERIVKLLITCSLGTTITTSFQLIAAERFADTPVCLRLLDVGHWIRELARLIPRELNYCERTSRGAFLRETVYFAVISHRIFNNLPDRRAKNAVSPSRDKSLRKHPPDLPKNA